MLISVVVCTYLRTEALMKLLTSLTGESGAEFEILIVDGSGENPSVRDGLAGFLRNLPALSSAIRLIGASKGLTRQRNVGLDQARGEVICFLDDDVTVEPGFLARLAEIFSQPEWESVGGVTAYDLQNYPTPVTFKWKLRRWFRLAPALVPGAIDRLGRAVPVSFLAPFQGVREIGYLPGFCMAYRRSAIGALRFDENLPTYGGEDRDFSFRAGAHCQLLICGDLRVRHHYERQSRDPDAARIYQDGFGSGRAFAKHARKSDWLEWVRFVLLDALVNLFGVLREPSLAKAKSALARTRGIVVGFRSWSGRMAAIEAASASAAGELG